METRVEDVEVEVPDLIGVHVVRKGLVVGFWAGGIGDLLLMFIVFVDVEPWRSKDIDFLEVQRDGANGHFFFLALAVERIHAGFDFKRVGGAVKVPFRNLELQFRNHGRSTAVEGVGAAGCAPLRVGPRGRKVRFQVKHHVDAAGGGAGVLDEEFHLNHSTGSEQHGVGLIGGQGQVDVVLEHRDARVLKDDRVALDVLHLKANRVVACCDACLVGVGEVPHQPVVVQFEIIVFEVLLEHGVGAVGRRHDEVHFFDVVSTKGISNLNRELHLTEGWSVVGRPLKLLSVVPVASEHLVAAVDTDARA